jgi:hypothetical protein
MLKYNFLLIQRGYTLPVRPDSRGDWFGQERFDRLGSFSESFSLILQLLLG